MSTYSTSLKIELIGTGEQSNVWGDTTNNNFEAFEQAIVGEGTITFPTDNNYTVALINSNTLQAARAFSIRVTSSGNLTATRELIITPGINKPYLVFNNTLGGQSITIKNASGAGVTIPNGSRGFVYNNSADFRQAFDYLQTLQVPTFSSSNVSITGGSITNITDLAVADGGTGASSFTPNTYLKGNGTGAIQAQSLPIPVSDGGTGQTTLAQNNVLLGNGLAGLQAIAPGSSGNVLTSNGVTWVSQGVPAVTPTRFSAGSTGFTPSTLTGPGDITLGGILNVANGGTGATTAVNAQTNLNVPSRTGAGASGTWGINITGSAATATSADNVNGVGQSWANLTGSRSFFGAIYSNTTGRPITIAVSWWNGNKAGHNLNARPIGSGSWIRIGRAGDRDFGGQNTITAIIPNNWEYMVDTFGDSFGEQVWSEMR